ncbi:MAG: hypothetical protein GEV09_22745 [Pseudonocardiaceae bacterium]|nr:hypothetical protein [Pseudonocardiaceae bacterium]
MDLLIQLSSNGVILGLLYALFAYGLSLIISTTSVLHFAHGFTLVAAAYAFWWMFQAVGINPLVAAAAALAIGGVVGVAVELVVYRPLRRADASNMVILAASLAVLALGQNLVILVFGADPKPIAPSAALGWSVTVGPLLVGAWDLLVIGSSAVVFVGLYLLQTRTRLGLSFRAVGDNPERAQTLGIRLQRAYVGVFLVGSVVAAVPAVLLAVDQPVTPGMGFNLLVKAIVALVIGGIGSMPGALAGGLLVGITEGLVVLQLPTEWGEFMLFLLLFVFVLLRPQGLTRHAIRQA